MDAKRQRKVLYSITVLTCICPMHRLLLVGIASHHISYTAAGRHVGNSKRENTLMAPMWTTIVLYGRTVSTEASADLKNCRQNAVPPFSFSVY